MKEYDVDNGFMGYVDGEYRLFACEGDYVDVMNGRGRGEHKGVFY